MNAVDCNPANTDDHWLYATDSTLKTERLRNWTDAIDSERCLHWTLQNWADAIDWHWTALCTLNPTDT